MARSSFSKGLSASVFLGAIALACLSTAYFRHKWRGLIVSNAGDAAANGYYNWEPRLKAYIKAKLPAGRRRVPSVYGLVSQGHEYEANATAPMYLFHLSEDYKYWLLMRSDTIEYVSQRGWLENTPPSTGWKTAPQADDRIAVGLEPPPQVAISGTKVARDPDPIIVVDSDGSHLVDAAAEFHEQSPAMEVMWSLARSPGTALLLAINLAVAYQLWAKKLSTDAVVISFALFWEEREYWRAFTAAFSHVEVLHLFFNMSSTWSFRGLEQQLGTLQFLLWALNFVVMTGAVKILMKFALVRWYEMEGQREQTGLGYSCVLFAFGTFSAVGMGKLCPLGGTTFCDKIWRLPGWRGDSLIITYSVWPFFLLGVTQVIMPRAGFIGHLAGIVVGYLTAWGFLPSTPVIAGAAVIFMIQRSQAWASKMPSYSLLLEDWAGGDANRVGRARMMRAVFSAHMCLLIASSCVFTWGSVLAEVMALVVGFNALQALKCCCCPDSETQEHRFCVNLAKAYGALSVILFVSDLLSFGAVLGQAGFLELSGVSESLRQRGLVLLVVAAAVHGAAVVACVEAVVLFRDGQTFLSAIGLKQLVVSHSINTGASGKATYSSSGSASKGGSFPGEGRALGTREASIAV